MNFIFSITKAHITFIKSIGWALTLVFAFVLTWLLWQNHLSITAGIVALIVPAFLWGFIKREKHRSDKFKKALVENRKWYSTLLSHMGDGLIEVDKNGIVTYLNSAAQGLTGWKEEEAKGNPLEVVFVQTSEDKKSYVENPVRKALRQGKIVTSHNPLLLIKKDKTEIFIENSAAPIYNEGAKIKGAALIFRNISQAK